MVELQQEALAVNYEYQLATQDEPLNPTATGSADGDHQQHSSRQRRVRRHLKQQERKARCFCVAGALVLFGGSMTMLVLHYVLIPDEGEAHGPSAGAVAGNKDVRNSDSTKESYLLLAVLGMLVVIGSTILTGTGALIRTRAREHKAIEDERQKREDSMENAVEIPLEEMAAEYRTSQSIEYAMVDTADDDVGQQ